MQNNSDVIHQAGLHWVIFLWPVILFVLGAYLYVEFESLIHVSYLLLGFSVIWGLMQWTLYQFSSITIKKKSVVIRTGLLVRQTLDIPVSKIESIDVRQSILGSLLGYGMLLISGTGGSKNLIDQIEGPLTCRRYIEQLINEGTS
jgi:uncharacterized membrane protein YdbT with pleckstrin-like domain